MKTISQEIGVISSPAIRTQSSNVKIINRQEVDRIIEDLKLRHEEEISKLKQATLDMVNKASKIVVAMLARKNAQRSVTSSAITKLSTLTSASNTVPQIAIRHIENGSQIDSSISHHKKDFL